MTLKVKERWACEAADQNVEAAVKGLASSPKNELTCPVMG
jgi:hypothetical protein